MRQWLLAASGLILVLSASAEGVERDSGYRTFAAPVAEAGPNRTVDELTFVQLDGTGSSDPDPGTTLQYQWTQVMGQPVTLIDANTARPSFTAPRVSATGGNDLFFELRVWDETNAESRDAVAISIRRSPLVPVANAGPDQTVGERSVVTLDGRGSSDPDPSDPLTYQWVQTAGAAVTLTGADTAQPTFTAPEVTLSESLTFELTVSEGISSATDTVNILVDNVNRPPVSHAGWDQDVPEWTPVTLSGFNSYDPDDPNGGGIRQYAWRQLTGPHVELLPTFTRPDPQFVSPYVPIDTVLTFELTVYDNAFLSSTDTVNITVRNTNGSLVANAGADQVADEDTGVTLDGSRSYDPDGEHLLYGWQQLAGPVVAIEDSFSSPMATFTAPEVTGDTVLTFQLVVSDGSAASEPKTVNITVRDVNRLPVAHAGDDQAVDGGVTVTLSGNGEDPEGDALAYKWMQTAGPSMTLSGAAAQTSTFTAPDLVSDTVFTFTLKVTDAQGLSAEDSVSITVKAMQAPPDDGGGAGYGCSSGSSAAGALMPLLLLGVALRSRRRWPRH